MKNKIITLFTDKVLVFAVAFAILLSAGCLHAQNVPKHRNKDLTYEKTEHDFGKFSINAGPQHCTFKYKNNTDTPIVINHILSSCGCTTPEWSKAPIKPGQSGEIKVTFLNDQGPFAFEKSLTVYVSSSVKPTVLRIRGIVTKGRAK